jgi:hypothetical protein
MSEWRRTLEALELDFASTPGTVRAPACLLQVANVGGDRVGVHISDGGSTKLAEGFQDLAVANVHRP